MQPARMELLRTASSLRKGDPTHSGYRISCAESLQLIATAQQDLAAFDDTFTTIADRRSLWPDDPDRLYVVVQSYCDFAVRLGWTAEDTATDQADRIHRCQAEAITTFSQAIDAGFEDFQRATLDKSLAPIQHEALFLDMLQP